MITITIPGNPIAKKRPRFVRRGKFNMTYNAQETEEGLVIVQAMQQMNGVKPICGPVDVFISFRIGRPRSHYGTGKNSNVVKQSAPEWPIKKPDIDNAVKFYLDCLNGIAWQDDAQVVGLRSIKSWGDPETVIMIKPVEPT